MHLSLQRHICITSEMNSLLVVRLLSGSRSDIIRWELQISSHFFLLYFIFSGWLNAQLKGFSQKLNAFFPLVDGNWLYWLRSQLLWFFNPNECIKLPTFFMFVLCMRRGNIHVAFVCVKWILFSSLYGNTNKIGFFFQPGNFHFLIYFQLRSLWWCLIIHFDIKMSANF